MCIELRIFRLVVCNLKGVNWDNVKHTCGKVSECNTLRENSHWVGVHALSYFISFAPQNIRKWITNNMGKVEKRSTWRGDLSETVGDYERLGLLELRARVVYINWRLKMPKAKMERFFSDRFSGLLNNLIFRRKGIESYKLKKNKWSLWIARSVFQFRRTFMSTETSKNWRVI